MKNLLLPLILMVFSCSNLDYDSGWLDVNSEQTAKIMLARFNKSDQAFINSGMHNEKVEYLSGDELSKKYEVPPSLRKQTNAICRIIIKNGAKRIQFAEFSVSRWEIVSITILKD